MSTIRVGDELNAGIGADAWKIERGKRNKRVVLGRDEQGWDSNVFEHVTGPRSFIIIGRIAVSSIGSRVGIIELRQGPDVLQKRQVPFPRKEFRFCVRVAP